MGSTDIVKSAYMVDPCDGLTLIKRDGDDSTEIDREYWQRVNQGENVLNAAKLFEQNSQITENVRREPVRVGKIKRDSFLELTKSNSCDDGDTFKDQIKTGKLNMTDLYPNNNKEDFVKGEIKIGKLNTKDLFNNKENEETPTEKPRMKIGKLDPKNMFDKSQERETCITKEKDMFNNVVIGKLNTKNIFESEDIVEIEKQTLQVGKINTREIFAENDTYLAKPCIVVGKLNIKESDLFDSKEEEEKPSLQIGKLKNKDLFTNNQKEDKDLKTYKPSVQPKKMKIQTLFPESSENMNSQQREEIKVGKIDASAFLQNTNDSSTPTTENQKQNIRVGKIDTSKLFIKEVEEEEEIPTRPTSVGKLRVGQLFQQNDSAKEEEEKKESFRVGRLKKDIWNTETTDDKKEEEENKESFKVGKLKKDFWNSSESSSEQQTVTEQVKLRGARRINKGNRISCLIENLHSDKKGDSDEECNEASDTEEEVKLGRNRMTEIQGIFSGQGSSNKNQAKMFTKLQESSSTVNFSEIQDLTDEGLVSSNRERFTTGNILGSQEGRRKSSAETNYIDKKHIESLTSKFEESTSGKACKAEVLSASHVSRKLKNVSDVFHHSKDDYTDCVKQEMKVKKLDTEKIFKNDKEEVSRIPSPKVGKLKLDEKFFEKSSADDQSNRSPEIRVGRIDSENIFKIKKEDDELKSTVKVGKLNKNVYNPSSDMEKETISSDIKVGKINSTDLFKEAEQNSQELLSICKPGKLSEDKLKFTSNSGEDEKDVKEDDTVIVPTGKVSERTSAFETKQDKVATEKLSPGPTLKRSESNVTSDMQKKYQAQVARNQSMRKEKSDVVVVVHNGKISDARDSFFQSMVTNTGSSSSSSSRLGTSILPTGLDSHALETKEVSQVVHKTSSKKGKDLFKRCAERQQEEETIEFSSEEFTSQQSSSSSTILPGVDFEEIEDEFEKLHREMMKDMP